MKTIKYLPPSGIPVAEIGSWCRDNRIPLIVLQRDYYGTPIRWPSRNLYKWGILRTYDSSYLVIRECDYTLVKLRF